MDWSGDAEEAMQGIAVDGDGTGNKGIQGVGVILEQQKFLPVNFVFPENGEVGVKAQLLEVTADAVDSERGNVDRGGG